MYCSLCHIHVWLLREGFSWESVVDNWDCSEVEIITIRVGNRVASKTIAGSREGQNLMC